MTHLEIGYTVILWIILGFFICNKADWYQDDDDYDPTLPGTLTVLFAPLVFIYDVINRIFVQKWH